MAEELVQWIGQLGIRDQERLLEFLQSLGVVTLDDLEYVTPAKVDECELKFVQREKLKRGLRELAAERGWRTEEDPGPSCSHSGSNSRSINASITEQLEVLRRALDQVMNQSIKLKMSDADIEKKRRQKAEAQRRWRQKLQNDPSRQTYLAKMRKTERDRKRKERERVRRASSGSDDSHNIPECDRSTSPSPRPNVSARDINQGRASRNIVQSLDDSSSDSSSIHVDNSQQDNVVEVKADRSNSDNSDHTEFVESVMPPSGCLVPNTGDDDLPKTSAEVTSLLSFNLVKTRSSIDKHTSPGESPNTPEPSAMPISHKCLPLVSSGTSNFQPSQSTSRQTFASYFATSAAKDVTTRKSKIIVLANQPAIQQPPVSGEKNQNSIFPGSRRQTPENNDDSIPRIIVRCTLDAESTLSLHNQPTQTTNERPFERQESMSQLRTLADVAVTHGASKTTSFTAVDLPQTLDEYLDNLPPTPQRHSPVSGYHMTEQNQENLVIDLSPSDNSVNQVQPYNDESSSPAGNSISDQDKEKSLLQASDSGDIKKLKQLIKAGASVNVVDDDGYSALYRASRAGHTDVVRELLEHGAKVEQGWWKPLLEAARRGKLEVVRVLIEKGADVNVVDAGDDTALISASRWGYTDIVRPLLEAGADVNAVDGGGENALISVSRWGHMDIVRLLLERGASVNAEDDDGYTALSHASRAGHTDVVRELLEHGADVEQGRRKPLIEAARSMKLDVVRVLIEKGADVNAVDAGGKTALISVSRRRGYTNIVRLLLKKGASVNSRDEQGHTALWHVRSELRSIKESPREDDCQQRLSATEKLLLKFGAKV